MKPVARQGFGTDAERYERGRPGYSAEVVAHVASVLGIGAGTRVLDLAAGTGKLTRLLVGTGAEVVAVEPVEAMRTFLAREQPAVEVLDGTAEAIPLPDASVDAATVAQAFHWFDPQPALAELHRVLRPGGGLALVWNERDESVPWVAELSRVTRWNAGDIPMYGSQIDVPALVSATGGRFTDVEHRQFVHGQVMDRDVLLDRFGSVSYIASMVETDRQQVLDAVLRVVEDFPETFTMPYRTDVFWCRRTP